MSARAVPPPSTRSPDRLSPRRSLENRSCPPRTRPPHRTRTLNPPIHVTECDTGSSQRNRNRQDHDVQRQANRHRTPGSDPAPSGGGCSLRKPPIRDGRARHGARERRIALQLESEQAVQHRVSELQRQASELDRQLIVNRDRLVLEEVGLFDFEHPAEASATLATELESLRSEIRQTNKLGSAITASSNFTFNNSAAKGQTFVNQMSRIMLRAYNAEAENAVKTFKAGNLASAQKRLSTAREQIAKQGQMIDLSVTDRYHWLRLKELELAARHEQAKAADREKDRERRAELREQKALEAEIKREKERLEKERAHYLNSIQRMRDSGDTAEPRPSRASWTGSTPRLPKRTIGLRTSAPGMST
jgi:hypothetical protein